MEGSSRRGETLGGAQVWQQCSPVLAQGEQQLSQHHPHPSQARRSLGQRRMELKHIFLCLPKLPELPTCFSLCVLVSYARGCLDPFLATQVLFFVPPAEGPAWPVFAVEWHQDSVHRGLLTWEERASGIEGLGNFLETALSAQLQAGALTTLHVPGSSSCSSLSICCTLMFIL